MEFEHVGKHCAHELCRQKDFLPFTCDACHRTYCLQHRSYLMHDCTASSMKDMTSLDCPVCGKSVKFTKAQDANLIWENHYLNGCSQQNRTAATPSSSQKIQCGRVGCTTILGPSNTINCSKCNKKVCIAHRMSEDHQCSSVSTNRAAFLQRFESTNTSAKLSSKTNAAVQHKSNLKTSTNGKTSHTAETDKFGRTIEDYSNTILGTASRRMKEPTNSQQESLTNPIVIHPSDYVCPFCNGNMSTIDELNLHVASAHSEEQAGIQTIVHGHSMDEICPICNRRFNDAVALVDHVERDHNGRSGTQQNANTDSGCRVA